jgi:peptidoglycan/LPS O-acetylase OafA/YrhL
VLSVVLFHTFPEFIKGGFIGVDIFFVISGFLISSIIMRSLEQNRFSFWEFYSRRFRRIFPALALVLLTCLVFGWLTLLWDEYRQLGKHVAAGAAFVSNFTLWGESGYFDDAAETKALLHLWSLGIEEQYYIVWPLLLWLAWRMRLNALFVVLLAGMLSFACNVALYSSDPSQDFYSPLTRFWELLAGSALAYSSCSGVKPRAHETSPRWRRWPQEMQSVIGALIIIVALLVVTKESPFPGFLVALPVLGTVMLISAGGHSWLNRVILSHRSMVSIGLISFPLYLWHWPILSLARIIESTTLEPAFRAASVSLSFILAWLTYRFVERWFRFGEHGGTKALCAAVLIVLIGLSGLFVFVSDGFPGRTAAQPIVRYRGDVGRESYLDFMVQHYERCVNDELRTLSMKDPNYGFRCFQSKPGTAIDVIVVGDSHAEHLLPAMAEVFPDKNVAVFLRASLPVIDNPYFSGAFALIANDRNIKTIVLAAQWENKLNPTRKDTKERLTRTLATLARQKEQVIVLGDVPNYSFNPKLCKYHRVLNSSVSACEVPLSEHIRRKAHYSKALEDAVAAVKGTHFLSLDPFFCNAERCSMVQRDEILYRDEHHLNVTGSRHLGRWLSEHLSHVPGR